MNKQEKQNKTKQKPSETQTTIWWLREGRNVGAVTGYGAQIRGDRRRFDCGW